MEWKKYPNESDWRFDIIDEAESQPELDELEEQYIIQYDSINSGYNIRYGGNGRGKLSLHTKTLISEKATARYKSQYERLKCGNRKRGIPKTAEHREKISNALKGRSLDASVRKRVRIANKKTWASRSKEEKLAILKVSHDRMRETRTKMAKKYPRLKSPTGVIYTIDMPLSHFADMHELNWRKLLGIFKEPHRHHKHWTVA